ncbi:MAG: hypothetical protein BAJALOKI2v1_590016 [Promethearchaeota archaeon]|nr:MAG: hypothetical protein BAJALOKI2v1_590016 [Candidatus Lokiarchaeota archaeon]
MSKIMDDPIEITDLEAFIEGLKTSFDSLEDAEPKTSQGFQAQLAKAISELRLKKMARTEKIPKHLGHVTKEDLKNFFLNELQYLKGLLESNDFNNRKKFELVMKITKLREKINNF